MCEDVEGVPTDGVDNRQAVDLVLDQGVYRIKDTGEKEGWGEEGETLETG